MSAGLNLTGHVAQGLSHVYNQIEPGHLHIDTLKFSFSLPFLGLSVVSLVEGACQAGFFQAAAILGDCLGAETAAVQACAEEALVHLNEGIENSWYCFSAFAQCAATDDHVHYGT